MKYNVTSSKGHDVIVNTLEEAEAKSNEFVRKGASQSSVFEVQE